MADQPENVPEAADPQAQDPDAIIPDTKDWTWVLERPCPECGFASTELAGRDVGDRTRASAAQWLQVLTRPDVRERPSPVVWSPLEYACHVRDVSELFDRRLALMLAEDDPLFENWDQDVTAVHGRYGEQDPARVAEGLDAGARSIADRFDSVTGDQWARTGRRSDGAVFTVETFGRYFVHDIVHHLHDVARDDDRA
jgi:hypothetical protein